MPGHLRQEQIVHLNDVVEQDFAGFDHVASDQRVALGGRKAPEIAGVIAAAKFSKLSRDARIKFIKACTAGEEIFDQMQSDDVTLITRALGARG